MLVLSKLIDKFSTTLIKTLGGYSVEIIRLILKFIWYIEDLKEPEQLDKKMKLEGLPTWRQDLLLTHSNQIKRAC